MSNLVFEKTISGINNTETGIINKLYSDGLADDKGNLKLDVIESLMTLDKANISVSDMRKVGIYGQVIGTDTRTEVVDTTTAPYKSIVLLIMKYGNDLYRGTGFLIKDNVVLTAAHNVYDFDLGKPADEVYIIGVPKDAAHVRTHTRLKVSVEYVSGGSQGGRYDWGLIKMNNSMTDLGTINVRKADDIATPIVGDVLIAGYPGIAQGIPTGDMWEADGSVEYYSANKVMAYTISTSGGNSGSPVMMYYGGGRTAIGIHVMGSSNYNYAKAIDDEVMAAINEFY